MLLSYVFSDCETSNLGVVVGRVSNGIGGASFILNGVTYNVSGSSGGWDKVLLLFVECITSRVMTLEPQGHIHHTNLGADTSAKM